MQNIPKQEKASLGIRIGRELKKNAGLYVLALIPFVFLVLFKYWPMYGVQIAFRNYSVGKGIMGSDWVGLKHIIRFIQSPKFWPILRNTLIISLYGLATFPLPILLALMLNYLPSQRYRKTIQMVSYAPHFISTVVMVGILLQFLDKNNGIINRLIEACGGETVNFVAKREYFYHIYQWSGVWQGVGYASVIYISALAGVSPELHEAAIVDGANIPQRIWHVDIPAILPTVCILLIMDCGKLLSVGYEKVYPVLEMAEDTGIPREKLIFSGSVDIALLQKDPEIVRRARIFLNSEEICRWLAPDLPDERSVHTQYITDNAVKVAGFMRALGVEALNVPYIHTTVAMIAAMRGEGIELSLWTVNDEEQQARLMREDLLNMTTRQAASALRIRNEIRG